MTRLVPIALVALLFVAGCGGDSTPLVTDDSGGTPTTSAAASDPTAELTYSGGTVSPIKAAPELGLRTWDGTPVRLGDYRGKATLVTFVYTGCPDVCPLIIDNLIRVKERLGPDGRRLQIVAVSVDPEGDTAAAVKRFLTAHRARASVDYLIGSRSQLERTWARWGVGAREDRANPALIEHSGVIWGVDPAGRRVTFYPASGFDAADIESDVRAMLAG